MADEVELKLELTPAAADAVAGSDLLATDPDRLRQRSVYFDTPEHDLASAGVSLRVRRAGEKRVQTVKADGAFAAGLFARSEWDRVVEDDTPVLDDANPVRALLGERMASIEAEFLVDVERSTWNIHEGDAAIELVLDRGEIVAGNRREAVCEIELELKSGEAAALFRMARKIGEVAPFRLGVLSKAERGYRLTTPPTTVFKAERLAFAGEATSAAAFQHIVQACVRHFRLNESNILDGRDPGALHQARVALRRLRSAFSIFGNLVADDAGQALRGELRWLASELGEARNLDVLLERSAPGALRERLATARDAAYDRVIDALETPRTRALMLDLVQWASDGNWLKRVETEELRSQPAREFAAATLNRIRRKVKREGSDLAQADDEARHDLRKEAKKLRYAAEFFMSLFDRKRERRRYKNFISALEELQDQLGALNDLATAPEVLEQLGLTDDPAAFDLLAGGKKKALIEAAVETHDALVDAKPFWR